MTQSISTSGHPRVAASRVDNLSKVVAPIPLRRLTLAVDRDRQTDPVPTVAAVGPSTDF